MMRLPHYSYLCLFVAVHFLIPFSLPAQNSVAADSQTVDFRYAPASWQTAICLPDDGQKTLVNQTGTLLYDFQGGGLENFRTQVFMEYKEGADWQRQELSAPRVPVVLTYKQSGDLILEEDTFALPPAAQTETATRRDDILWLRIQNPSTEEKTLTPRLVVQSEEAVVSPTDSHLRVGGRMHIFASSSWYERDSGEKNHTLRFPPIRVPAGQERSLAVRIVTTPGTADVSSEPFDASALRQQAESFWRNVSLPYGRIQVPDEKIQALVDSSIRNIYQAREIKKGLPAFQVGPTVYRGLWVVDGSFLLEAVTFLNRVEEARPGTALSTSSVFRRKTDRSCCWTGTGRKPVL